MRHINEIIVHCTATRPSWRYGEPIDTLVAEVRRWHVVDNGWSDIGYHFLIGRRGQVAKGRPIERNGAGVKGHNKGVIHIALFGGHGAAATDEFSDHFTAKQEKALRKLIADLQAEYPTIDAVSSHNFYANKGCPGFNVGTFMLDAPAPKPKPAPKLRKPRPVWLQWLQSFLKGLKR